MYLILNASTLLQMLWCKRSVSSTPEPCKSFNNPGINRTKTRKMENSSSERNPCHDFSISVKVHILYCTYVLYMLLCIFQPNKLHLGHVQICGKTAAGFNAAKCKRITFLNRITQSSVKELCCTQAVAIHLHILKKRGSFFCGG